MYYERIQNSILLTEKVEKKLQERIGSKGIVERRIDEFNKCVCFCVKYQTGGFPFFIEELVYYEELYRFKNEDKEFLVDVLTTEIINRLRIEVLKFYNLN